MAGPYARHEYVQLPSSNRSETDDEEDESRARSDAVDQRYRSDDDAVAKPLLADCGKPLLADCGKDVIAACSHEADASADVDEGRADAESGDVSGRENCEGVDKEKEGEGCRYIERMGIVATVPHLVVVLAVLVLAGYTGMSIRAENARQVSTEDLERRSAFVYLVTPNVTDIGKLGASIQSVNRYFKTDLNYQIVVIHEDMAPVVQGRLQSLSIAPVRFREYPLRGPFDTNMSRENLTSAETLLWRRHHGVRFWFRSAVLAEGTKRSMFDDLDYVIRLGSDSLLTGEVTRDVIREFVLSGAQYGYRAIGKDCRRNETYGVRELARSYVELNGITPRSTELWAKLMRGKAGSCVPCFEDKFEMMNMRFFRSHSGIQDWIRVVDANGGIYRHGWGEAALRYITVALYAAPEKVMRYGYDVIPLR